MIIHFVSEGSGDGVAVKLLRLQRRRVVQSLHLTDCAVESVILLLLVN